MGRRAEAVAAIEEAVGIYRRLAVAAPDAYLPDLALSLNNLSGSLAEVGRWAEAVAQIEEAACIYRRLAEAAPDAYLPDLARSLYNLALVQAETDARNDAWLPVTQSIATYRELTAAWPDISCLTFETPQPPPSTSRRNLRKTLRCSIYSVNSSR